MRHPFAFWFDLGFWCVRCFFCLAIICQISNFYFVIFKNINQWYLNIFCLLADDRKQFFSRWVSPTVGSFAASFGLFTLRGAPCISCNRLSKWLWLWTEVNAQTSLPQMSSLEKLKNVDYSAVKLIGHHVVYNHQYFVALHEQRRETVLVFWAILLKLKFDIKNEISYYFQTNCS